MTHASSINIGIVVSLGTCLNAYKCICIFKQLFEHYLLVACRNNGDKILKHSHCQKNGIYLESNYVYIYVYVYMTLIASNYTIIISNWLAYVAFYFILLNSYKINDQAIKNRNLSHQE